MKTIILTGSSGFIGSYMLNDLSKSYNLILPSRNPQKLSKVTYQGKHQQMQGLFYDGKIISEYQKYNPEVIIHLASIRGEGKGGWNDYRRVNVFGTEQLLDFALTTNVKLFVYFSTVGIYGTIPKVLPAGIHTEPNPDNFYHQSKYEAEQLVIEKLKGKVPFAIIRPTITYGPGDNGFLVNLIDLVRKKKFPLIRKNIKIHLLNVHTISELILLLIQGNFSNQLIINLADHKPVEFHELVNLIYSHFHRKNYPGYLQVPSWTFSAGKYVCDTLDLKKLKTSLQLVSESWYYEVSPLRENYSFKQIDTLDSISELLYHEFPQKQK